MNRGIYDLRYLRFMIYESAVDSPRGLFGRAALFETVPN